ncbi:hypothetical protein EGW08_023462 [Elysia chlorotica]|uniref:Uncharacterized protein n=1 Tax=Elysia chlorotica TaxID=188477 RepID=A0A433SIM5_ELYCH|nr:hypothetical protein EGW08_023462 [Elysia chlorotica]
MTDRISVMKKFCRDLDSACKSTIGNDEQQVFTQLLRKQFQKFRPYASVDNISDYLTNILNIYKQNNLLTWHSGTIPDDEVWIKAGADHGKDALYKAAQCHKEKFDTGHRCAQLLKHVMKSSDKDTKSKLTKLHATKLEKLVRWERWEYNVISEKGKKKELVEHYQVTELKLLPMTARRAVTSRAGIKERVSMTTEAALAMKESVGLTWSQLRTQRKFLKASGLTLPHEQRKRKYGKQLDALYKAAQCHKEKFDTGHRCAQLLKHVMKSSDKDTKSKLTKLHGNVSPLLGDKLEKLVRWERWEYNVISEKGKKKELVEHYLCITVGDPLSIKDTNAYKSTRSGWIHTETLEPGTMMALQATWKFVAL